MGLLTSLLALPVCADTLSSNLTSTSGGSEAASGDTWLAASFATGSSSSTLSDVSLLLANLTSSTVAAQLTLYADDGLNEPGAAVGTLTASSGYSTTLSDVTFTGSDLTLSADTTYWVVLSATSGELDWSYAADDNEIGTGFTDTWAASYDAGSTWFTYASSQDAGVDPLQMDVETTSSVISAAPEPGTAPLVSASCGLLLFTFAKSRRG